MPGDNRMVTAEDAPLPPLVWVDMEMSGLDPATCVILEIAVLVTDADLQEIATGPEIVIHHPESVLAAMDEWNTTHHGGSGLSQRVRESTVSLAAAEEQVLAFITASGAAGAPLCGNSVHLDRAFLARYMPSVNAALHYRNIDVSTVKELVRRWYPGLPLPQKREAHRALSDIRESLAELRFYRERVFLVPGSHESSGASPA